MADVPKKENKNTFKEAILNPDTFSITWEQIPGRGAFESQQLQVIENARKAQVGGKVNAVSIGDNPGGNPAISAFLLCTEIKKLGIEPLVHFALRDKNRNDCESLLYGLSVLDVKNLLILTGDYPSNAGFQGKSKPVFDLDSVHGLQLVEAMNRGLEYESSGKKITLSPADFFAGAAVSPFKQSEPEIMGQYSKLKKKIIAGAKFLITQVGYDARKLDELLLWLNMNGYNTPVLANIYVLTSATGRVMNANQIPGCVVTDKLLAQLDEERKDKDKGRFARLDRAAKMYAIARGIGYSGAHIGGVNVTYDMVEYIINKGETLSSRWQELIKEFDFPQQDGFYLFEKNEKTGLNSKSLAPCLVKASRPLIYTLSRMAHATVFNPDTIIFKALKPAAKSIDDGVKMKSILGAFEHLNKVLLFNCQKCGDCALSDIAFFCPMSQCPKGQRNGPCGGSYEGWCEVHPNRKCIWVKAYQRLKKVNNKDINTDCIVPPCDWELEQTSSWLNFYMGRDHTAKRLGIKPPEKKTNDKRKETNKSRKITEV